MNGERAVLPSAPAEATAEAPASPPATMVEATVHRPSIAGSTFPERPEPPRRAPGTALERLVDAPARFDFDAAVAILMRAEGRGDPGTAISFRAEVGLGFVSSDVAAVSRDGERSTLRTGAIGLTGSGGDLPRPYTELVNDEQRRRSPALAAFLDLLAQRPIAQFADAGIKYRPHRTAEAGMSGGAASPRGPRDGMRDALLALIGYADPGLLERLRPGPDPLLYFSGTFAARGRPADRLASMLSDWLGLRVEVEQFAGGWLDIGRDGMTSLPRAGVGRFNRLGVDATVGARAWDVQSRVVLRIGPLPLPAFEDLLPGGRLVGELCGLAKSYLGLDTGFSVNPVLAADAVPPCRVGAGASSRLGLTAWLPVTGGRRDHAGDARFAGDRLAR